MDDQNIIAFLIYMGIAIAGYVCVREFVHNLLGMKVKQKAAVYHAKAKFSIITIVYIICLYLQAFIGLLPSFVDEPHFIFYTWLDQVVFYFLTSVNLFLLGIINLGNVEFLYERRKVQEIKRIWITLKLVMIPYYLLNGMHYLYAIEPPEEGDWLYVLLIFFLLGMIPVMLFIFPCVLNFLSGCIGWNYIRYLQGQGEGEKKLSNIHYVLQSFPVLDLISMAVILKKYKCSPESGEEVIVKEIPSEESAAQLTERKRKKKIDAAIFFLFILLSIVVYFLPQLKNIIISEPIVYEMTEEEKRLLKNLHMNVESYGTIDAGELSQMQVYELEVIRYANHVIEEKYPDIQFRICSAQNADVGYKFYIKEESNDEFFEMDVYDDKGLTEQDNLYVFFCGEAYNEYLEEQLKGKIAGLAEVECVFWKVVDGERSANISIENILDGELDAIPGRISLSISAKGKSEEECKNQEKIITEAVRQLQIPTNFWVYFWDETEQEIWSEKKEKEEIYLFWIQEGE